MNPLKKKGIIESAVKVIDSNKSENLEKLVINKINSLRTLKDTNFEGKISIINLTNSEKSWIINASDSEWKTWEEEIKKASKKMLAQGIINTLALEQLNEASSLQLIDLGIKDSPTRSMVKLMTRAAWIVSGR